MVINIKTDFRLHTYLYADTFTVMLTAISGTGCENKKQISNGVNPVAKRTGA